MCARCEGCGYVTGNLRWEIAWSRWADAADPSHAEGVLEAHPCPDCGGTGALIQMEAAEVVEVDLPTRRGLRRPTYAAHVETVLSARYGLRH
jgi:DnaJ-class molecular chaperone